MDMCEKKHTFCITTEFFWEKFGS